MYKFRFTNKTVEDLTTIWNYTFDNWSESQADIYYLLLIENCKGIARKLPVILNWEKIIQESLKT